MAQEMRTKMYCEWYQILTLVLAGYCLRLCIEESYKFTRNLFLEQVEREEK